MRYYPLLQFVYRDHRVHLSWWSCRVRLVGICDCFLFLRDVEDSDYGNFVIKLVFSSRDLDNLLSIHSIFVGVSLVSLCFGGVFLWCCFFPGNLASIALSSFVDGDTFNFQKLYEVTKVVTKNLNKVIDRNYYPVEASTEPVFDDFTWFEYEKLMWYICVFIIYSEYISRKCNFTIHIIYTHNCFPEMYLVFFFLLSWDLSLRISALEMYLKCFSMFPLFYLLPKPAGRVVLLPIPEGSVFESPGLRRSGQIFFLHSRLSLGSGSCAGFRFPQRLKSFNPYSWEPA